MRHVYDDGGRAAAGYKRSASDCVCRAIAIATGTPYSDVYAMINDHGSGERKVKRRAGKSSARTGVYKQTTRRIMEQLGWTWHPTMQVGSGCRVHLRADELPKGRIVCKLSKHVAAVIDGVLHDTYDCTRDGTRCVYGYWTKD